MKYTTLTIITVFLLLASLDVLAESSSTSSTITNTTTSGGAVNNNGNATATQSTTYSTTNSTTVNSHDNDIISAVYKNYAQDPALTGTKLTVNFQNGILSVSGTVTAQSQADEAVIAAKKVPGVQDVRSSINVITANPNAHDQPPQTPNY